MRRWWVAGMLLVTVGCFSPPMAAGGIWPYGGLYFGGQHGSALGRSYYGPRVYGSPHAAYRSYWGPTDAWTMPHGYRASYCRDGYPGYPVRRGGNGYYSRGPGY